MWREIWKQIQSDAQNVSVDHPMTARYKRAAEDCATLISMSKVIAYRDFAEEEVEGETRDVTYIATWMDPWWEEGQGTYAVFKAYYSHRKSSANQVGKRTYLGAELLCFYDESDELPPLKTIEDALNIIRRKEGYHEVT